jgi:NAD(P)-dependent dehydrogenase (short-subunit alcohol dehydrogenase family)
MQLGKSVAAVVTGGASGLGAATARALAGKGVKVAIFDLNEAEGKKLAKEIGGHYFKCDVTSESSVDAALAAARSAHGQERILVNCAGIAIGKRTVRRVKETGAIEPHDIASFAKCVQVNLIGTFLMITKCAAGMLSLKPLDADGQRGVIVNTSSVAAEDGQMGQVAYAASKGGVLSMTLPIARDLAKDGVRVVTIDVRQPPGRGPGGSGRASAVSVPARRPCRVRTFGNSHMRERDAERRGHSARRSHSACPSLEGRPADCSR